MNDVGYLTGKEHREKYNYLIESNGGWKQKLKETKLLRSFWNSF